MRRILLLSAVGIGVALAWLRYPRPSIPARGVSGGDIEAVGEATVQAPDLLWPQQALEPQQGERRRALHPGAGAGTPSADAGGPAPAAGSRADPDPAFELLLVEAEGGRPLPGAEVFLIPDRQVVGTDVVRILASGLDLDSELASLGLRFLADGAGRVRLPPFPNDAMIAAVAPGLWGWRKVGWDEPDPVLLELTTDPQLRVRVVDRHGTPAPGVPVALRLRDGNGYLDVLVRRTDEDGAAVLQHVLQVMHELGRKKVAALAVSAPLAEPIEVPISADALPEQVLELVLPSTIALEVVVVNAAGDPLALRGYAAIALAPPGTEPISADTFSFGKGLAFQWTEDGRARFPFVGAGIELAVSFHFVDGREPIARRWGADARPGEEARLELPASEAVPVLIGRAIDRREQVLASRRLDAAITLTRDDGTAPRRDRVGLRTDGAGEFQLSLAGPWGGDVRRSLELSAEPTPDDVPRRLELELPSSRPTAEMRLDCLLEPLPIVAEGRVVDEAGAPIRGARLQLLAEEPGGGVAAWRPADGVEASSGPAGGFTLYADHEASRFAIDARHPRYRAPARVEFGRGQRDVEVRMVAVGALAGRFLLEPEAGRPKLAFRLRARADGLEEEYERQLEEDGSFELARLRAGRFDLEVALPEEGALLVGVADLEVRAGETCRDPRLAAIDLRGHLRRIVIDVGSASGSKIEGLGVAVRRPESASPEWRTKLLRGAQVELITAGAFLDLELAARGHRPRLIERVDSDLKVVLEEGLPVLLRILGPTASLSSDESLVTGLRQIEAPRPWHVGGQVQTTVESDGSARLSAPGPGTYQAFLRLRRGDKRETGIASAARRFGIAESTLEQIFTLELSREDLRAARAELEAR